MRLILSCQKQWVVVSQRGFNRNIINGVLYIAQWHRSKPSQLLSVMHSGSLSMLVFPRTPLFQPLQNIDESNLLQWAFDAHRIVADTNCYKNIGARIKVPTELNINT